ncbi:MAG: hypothetical protein CM1200mP18_12260 [Gammaproteobacteria bacterium]|nr:MAG: hypothetical protein CM1200mP18_12260 [Gammaproteobacteria bacterium]
MGKKIHPNGFRLGVIRDWDAKWFASRRDYAKNLVPEKRSEVFYARNWLMRLSAR